jgi:hypothetical protein
MAFYEVRQYTIRPGKMMAWLELMEGEILPLQISKGMVVTASFRGEDDDSVYIWLRRFESEAERVRLYAAVYESEHWQTQIRPRIGELMDREQIKVLRVVPTSISPSQ